jgi:O-antigen ligase
LIYFNNYKQIFLNILVLIFPISFLFGRTFVEVFLILISIYTIVNLKKWKKYIIDNDYIIILLFFFYFAVCLSTLINLEILNKLTDKPLLLKSFLNFRFIIYIISVWYVLDEIIFKKKIFIFTIGVYILFLVDGYTQFFSGQNLLGYQLISTGRLTGIFEDEQIFGSYIQKVLPLVIILFILIFKDKVNYLKSLLIILSFSSIIIFFSGDRSALLLYSLFLILNLIYLSNLRKIILLNFLITSLLTSVIIFTGAGKNLKSLDKRYNLKSDYNMLINKNNASSTKLKFVPRDYYGHYLIVKEMTKDNLIFGKGIKSFRVMCRTNLYPVENGVCSTHPHNYYLQSLSSGGLIAFFFLSLIFLIFTFKLIKLLFNLFNNKKNNNILSLTIITVFVYLWPIIPTGNFFNNWISGFNCFALGLFLFANSKFKNNITQENKIG